MAANDYFKVAAANIRRAIEFKRSEINDLRAQNEAKKRETAQQVQSIQAQIKAEELYIANSQVDQSKPRINRTEILKSVADMHAEIANVQQELTQLQAQIAGQVSNIEGELPGLEQLASSLESRN